MTKPTAILGTGKTGGMIVSAIENAMIFSRKNPITLDRLQQCQDFICFLPGPILEDHMSLLMESKLSGVIGTTGVAFPPSLSDELCEKNLCWIFGRNFSLGIQALRLMLENFSKAQSFLPENSLEIFEKHHQHKLDAPSGTALAMKEWLNWNHDISFNSQREGEEIGYHQLIWNSGDEEIKVSHQANSRQVFAKGAIWALSQLRNNPQWTGLKTFEELVEHAFIQKQEKNDERR